MTTKVSIIIPCYNQGSYLAECLHSVQDQTRRDFEVIIVNDGSTDQETVAVLKSVEKSGYRVVHQQNMGLAEARNTGIRNASGIYILPLDSDDLIVPSFLERTVEILEKQENVGIVGTGASYFGEYSGDVGFLPYRFPNMLLTNRLTCTSLFRKADWELTGGYNSNMRYGMEDYDFWLSIIELGRDVVQIPEPLFLYRRHGVTMSGRCNGDRYKEMKLQLVDNHAKLYASYPTYRDAFLYGKRSCRHRVLKTLVNLANFFIPSAVTRRKLRALCRDIP